MNQNTQTKCNKDILRKCSMALYCVSFRNENERGINVSKKGLVSDKYIDQTVQRRGKITLAQNRNSRKSVVEIVVVIFLFVKVLCGFVLPELAFLVLDGNFDDSWFVNNASGPLAFFNDANDPSLVAFLLFNVLKEFSR